MKKNFYFFFSALTIFLLSFQAKASHDMGGDLSYTWLGGNIYRFELNMYRDCSGIPAATSVTLSITSASCGISRGVQMDTVPGSGQEITPICPGVQTTCNGGTTMGVQKYTYAVIDTLQGNCSDWVFSVSDCCRNAAITNLSAASSFGIYIQATLDNLNFPFNNSPSFANDPVVFLSAGSSHTINNGAHDIDGDSLMITLAPALDNLATTIPYMPGYSYTNPILSAPAMNINPFTGDIFVTPTQPDVDVVVYTVNEYRGGQLISSVSRDIQVIISNSTNNLPTLSGVNGSGNYVTSVCAGNTLQFTIASSDLDLTDSSSISLSSPSGLNVSSTSYGAQQDSILVTVVTDTTMISAQAYLVYANVSDNACPFHGQQQYAFEIYVNACSQDVWPGDANSDLTCNLYDLLPIGLAYNASGPVRAGASTAWTAQAATDWGQTFASSVDYKHADCNGDGIVDANDTTVIGINYGQTHPLRLAPIPSVDAINNMYLIASRDSAGPNDSFTVQTLLGSPANPVNAVYGIAYRIEFDPAIVDSTLSTFQFVNSSLGTPGYDLLTFVRPNWSAGFIDAAAVRTDHVNVSTDSLISLFDVVIIDNVSARLVCNFNLSGIRGVLSDGTIENFMPVDDSVSVDNSTTGIYTNAEASRLYVFPNPAKETVSLYSRNTIDQVRILDLTGKEVMNVLQYHSGQRLDVSHLPQGCYILQTKNASGAQQSVLSISR
ncbi:MAG TPA: T9SS type A sorting domain-containing protein [Bacteroidia bacterium]|nr:T9SS type A sorting domain-containing protein [Bacteroidia bacterium]